MKSIHILITIILLAIFQLAHSQIGDPAPDFTVTDTEGNTHRLYDYLDGGRTVVLDFYYTTCVPCQFYSPQVNLAYEKYGCNNAETFFMGIDYNDTNSEVEAYDEEYSIQYPSVSGLNGGGNAVVNNYNIIGFPTFYVIDSTKKIVEVIDPPTLQVFDFRFASLGIQPAACETSIQSPHSSKLKPMVSPNPVPSGSEINIHADNLDQGSPVQFILCNSIGQDIQAGLLVGQGDHFSTQMSDDVIQGLYFLRIKTRDNVYTVPVVIK